MPYSYDSRITGELSIMRKLSATLIVAAIVAIGICFNVSVSVTGPKAAQAEPPDDEAPPTKVVTPTAEAKPTPAPAPKVEAPKVKEIRPPAPEKVEATPTSETTTEEVETAPKPECGPKSADEDGVETVCEDDKVCNKDKCVEDPCKNVTCSDSNTYGCQVAAAVHYRGLTSEEAVRRYLLKSKFSDSKMEKFNEGLTKSLRQTYGSTYSYTTASAVVKEMKTEELCEATQEAMTRLDGVHLMYRIKRHDAALRDINEDDAPVAPAPEPKVETPKAPSASQRPAKGTEPKVMKVAPAPAPAKLATPAIATTPKGEERMVRLPVGLKK